MNAQLRQVEIKIEDLYLDPNNPRFVDIQDQMRPVPPSRITETGVQETALERILDERFEVKQLKDSIRAIGFLMIDRLVATPLPDIGKYVVIEGNRRLGAVKSLIKDHANGEVDLSPELQKSLSKLSLLVLDEPDAAKRDHLARTLQGVRHVSGIRPWGPYQQAQIVAMMLDDNRGQSEICEILGLPKKRINSLRRCFYALKQMRGDDDYGDEAKPSLFSHFDDIFKLPRLRDWLEWDDDRNLFLNEEHRKLLYSWFVGTEDDSGHRQAAKILDHKEIRKLPQLMDDAIQFKRFCESPTLRLDEAMEGVVAPRPEIQWQSYVAQLINILNRIPAVDLEHATTEDKELLVKAQNLCTDHLKIIGTVSF